jgi:hypothetical protein
LGSLVQKGKLAASAPALVSALKMVDLPTFGKPTMPHLKPIANIPFFCWNRGFLPAEGEKYDFLPGGWGFLFSDPMENGIL